MRKRKLDPVDRCVGADPGAIYAIDTSLELREMGSSGHVPSIYVIRPPNLRRRLWMSWLLEVNTAWTFFCCWGVGSLHLWRAYLWQPGATSLFPRCLQGLTASFPGLCGLKVDGKCVFPLGLWVSIADVVTAIVTPSRRWWLGGGGGGGPMPPLLLMRFFPNQRWVEHSGWGALQNPTIREEVLVGPSCGRPLTFLCLSFLCYKMGFLWS